VSGAEFVSFGCRLNTYESEVMRGHAEKAGVENAIVFNTCAVTGEAARQARQAIRRAHREKPDAKIIVTGCAAQTDAKSFAAMPEVSLILGNEEKLKPESWQAGANERVRVSNIMEAKTARLSMIEGLTDRTRAFVQVQNGCDHRCTFCIIPYGRGNSRSVPLADVVEQVRRFVANGYAEVVLSGVDITSWGADLEDAPKLGLLVQAILRDVPELRRLRLSSIDCIESDAALLEVMAHDKRFMPHLHISLQSGDNMILKRMKRRHTREDAIEFCRKLKSLRPEFVFGADIIAGFPTETEEMFENSLRVVDECELTFLHVFPFSPRPETPAARMPQLDKAVIKSRAARLRAKGEERNAAFLARAIGSVQRVLVETQYLGRNEQFAPVKFAQSLTPGAIVEAHVIAASRGFLEGRLG
jgi:threonylcarbamoyladenosine tRNA methylthiotransferase MtaB